MVPAVWADTTWVDAGPVSGLWEAGGSPYIVRGDIQVPARKHLEIGAGVTVYFTGHCRVTVEGALYTTGPRPHPST